MLYFIQSGSLIKIGRGKPLNRYKAIKTASPYECRLLMAIDIDNEWEAERALHEHFKAHRSNGEWFEINFSTAFRALIDLKLIPDHPQMVLELPTVPPRDPGFETWFRAGWPDHQFSDDLEHLSDELDQLWHAKHSQFEEARARHGTLDEMIEGIRPVSEEEGRAFVSRLREMLMKQEA